MALKGINLTDIWWDVYVFFFVSFFRVCYFGGTGFSIPSLGRKSVFHFLLCRQRVSKGFRFMSVLFIFPSKKPIMTGKSEESLTAFCSEFRNSTSVFQLQLLFRVFFRRVFFRRVFFRRVFFRRSPLQVGLQFQDCLFSRYSVRRYDQSYIISLSASLLNRKLSLGLLGDQGFASTINHNTTYLSEVFLTYRLLELFTSSEVFKRLRMSYM